MSDFKIKFIKNCSCCGFESSEDTDICLNCGEQKKRNFIKSSISDLIISDLANKVDFIENPASLIKLILHLTYTLVLGLILDPLVQQSKLLSIFYVIFAVVRITEELANRFRLLRIIHQIVVILSCGYLGAGFGILIYYTGRIHKYSLGDFFDPFVIVNSLSKNSLSIVGAFAGVILLFLIKFIKNIISQ